MKEAGKGNLLVPLGIGAGLLLLLLSKKKADAASVPTEPAINIPTVNSEDASVPQLNPDPAPKYTQAITSSDGDSGDDENNTEDDAAEQGNEEDDGNGIDDFDSDDTQPNYSSGQSSNRGSSSSGSSYTPYQPSSSINVNRTAQPVPTAQPITANAKSLRFLSDQARQFTARQVTKVNPLFIGNGKPRMGAQLPVSYRPGAATPIVSQAATKALPQQAIVISSNTASSPNVIPSLPASSTTVRQTTIFPLRFGVTNAYVKEVQRKLGVSATGYFGTLTKAAIQKRFGVSEISEAVYKQIITGKVAVKPIVKAPIHKSIPVKKKVKKLLHKPIQKVIRK